MFDRRRKILKNLPSNKYPYRRVHSDMYHNNNGNVPDFIEEARRRGRFMARLGYVEKTVKVDAHTEAMEYRKKMVENTPKGKYANAFYYGYMEEKLNMTLEKKGDINHELYTGSVLDEMNDYINKK